MFVLLLKHLRFSLFDLNNMWLHTVIIQINISSKNSINSKQNNKTIWFN